MPPRSMQFPSKLVDDLVFGFVAYCDTNELTLQQGEGLAEELAEALASAVGERNSYLIGLDDA